MYYIPTTQRLSRLFRIHYVVVTTSIRRYYGLPDADADTRDVETLCTNLGFVHLIHAVNVYGHYNTVHIIQYCPIRKFTGKPENIFNATPK